MKHRQRLLGTAAFGAAMCLISGAATVGAQTCTTQSKLDTAMRSGLHDAAMSMGNSIKTGDANAVKAATLPELAANFGATDALIHSTSEKLAGDILQVTQLYMLDASTRKAGENTNADFSCSLKDVSGSETDFSINGLPPGVYGFAMVEASGGARPWLLSLLLQKQAGAWKLAGFYPKARTAAGHDGLWFWKAARQQASMKQSLVSWLYYQEAAALLQPAPFVSSSNLEKLRGEQRESGPSELANGISSESPFVLQGPEGTTYKVNSLVTEATDDGKSLRLMLHVAEDPGAATDAIRAHSEAAARALMKVHPELQPVYNSVFVFADGPAGNPPVVTLTMSQLQ